MYYISTNKNDCEAYNDRVTQGEGYNGTTQQWVNVITHKNGDQFAILAHEDYTSEMELVDELPEDWKSDIDI